MVPGIISDCKSYSNMFKCRYSCSMEVPEEDSLVITGGLFDWGSTQRVTKYDKYGNFIDMALMNDGRGQHACGSYLNNGQERVCLNKDFISKST